MILLRVIEGGRDRLLNDSRQALDDFLSLSDRHRSGHAWRQMVDLNRRLSTRTHALRVVVSQVDR